MVKTYKAHCKACDKEYTVKYGSKNKRKIIYETYSCPQCHNLFSCSNIENEFSCPDCGNKNLIRYNMNKDDNVSFYRKMYEEKMLPIEKYEEIMDFWKTVKSDECPQCGKHALSWNNSE